MPFPDFEAQFLANTPDGILFADATGVIRFWNAGCERMFGYTAGEAIGQSLDIIIPETLRARHWQGFAHTVRTGQSRYAAGDVLAVPASRKDGSRLSVEFSIVPFRDAENRLIGMGAVMRDVSKRFEETKALRKALAAARA
ncbi:MAG TPA: PAS domain-containing protein [Hyphomicrobiaceae bacterium]|nr:PAS domain-containing protein [Hyphomicrobiaceae bacterium]